MPRRTKEEAAIDERLKKEQEANDLEAFLLCYERATGFLIEVEEEAEDPDFIGRRSDGLTVGIELTAVWEGPENSFWRGIFSHSEEWDVDDACCKLWEQVEKKTDKIKNYRTKYNILVLLNIEANFGALCARVSQIPYEDFVQSGFSEVWLGDYSGLREGMYSEIELFGLYPKQLRDLTERSDHDRKPYQ